MDPWTQFLSIVSQVVTPAWNDLLQYIPLLLLGLLPLTVLMQARAWRHNAARNRSRVPQPFPAGPVPSGVHLPPPSIWPFVAPIGLFFIFLSLVFGGGSLFLNPVLFVIGLAIAAGGALGWFLDAGREYRQLDAGDHGMHLVEETAGVPIPEVIPEGIHLPGPSAWPFLAPIGLFFVFLGLIFGPILIAGGLAMAAIAAIGWYLDAGREYRQVEEGHHAEPATRDPEQAFPKRLMPVYAGIAAATILFTLTPWLLTFLPRTAVEPAGPPPTSTPAESASAATAFDVRTLVVVADKPFTITFDNKQAGVPHNIWIYDSPALGTPLFRGEDVTGPKVVEYHIDPLPAGQYTFICNIHPPMVGTLIVR